jgi:hypothetical protein
MIPEALPTPPWEASNPRAEDFHSQRFHSRRIVSRMSR